ncbi:histidine phosphatase family protein [Micromonospora sp. RP3T]|uniref:histidine phosphatase family protein n=1 Tax=Micromonospora sp. RP3T TaxID=2135446 RepID=UPI003D702812
MTPASTADQPVPGSRTRLILVRHAESIANVTGRLGGHHTCEGLTERGRAQAMLLRDRLAAARVEATALLTSQLRRAAETADIIAPGIGSGQLQPVGRCALCEVHWGDMEGQRLNHHHRADDIFEPVVGGRSESWLRFMLRARRALDDVARENSHRTTVVVTHAGVIQASMYHFASVAGRHVVDLAVDYTSITVWSRAASDPRWRLGTYNDHAHLPEDIPPPESAAHPEPTCPQSGVVDGSHDRGS